MFFFHYAYLDVSEDTDDDEHSDESTSVVIPDQLTLQTFC